VDEYPAVPPLWRIIIADDHPLWCSGLRSLLESSDSLVEAVAEATDGQQALEFARTLKPDLGREILPPVNDVSSATHEVLRNSVKTKFTESPFHTPG
jgi:CheY-like chemotaxis protein